MTKRPVPIDPPARPKPLSEQQITHALRQLNDWHWDTAHGNIVKTWVFDQFSTATEFFAQLALLSESQDHHPEVLSAYTHMQIRLWTHDVQGITEKDFDLAKALDLLVATEFSNRLGAAQTP